MERIRFTFEGRNYEVGIEAYEQNLIALPDGTILEVGIWLETAPPKPRNLRRVKTPPTPPKAKEV